MVSPEKPIPSEIKQIERKQTNLIQSKLSFRPALKIDKSPIIERQPSSKKEKQLSEEGAPPVEQIPPISMLLTAPSTASEATADLAASSSATSRTEEFPMPIIAPHDIFKEQICNDKIIEASKALNKGESKLIALVKKMVPRRQRDEKALMHCLNCNMRPGNKTKSKRA